MIRKLLTIFIFFSLIFALGCKGGAPQADLNTPLGLTGTFGAGQIIINFYGFNQENHFQGYNIYITDCTATSVLPGNPPVNSWTTIQTNLVKNHFNATYKSSIESNYLISSANTIPKSFPTLPSSLVQGVIGTVTLVSYTITYDGVGAGVAIGGGPYCIGVTAVNLSDLVESVLSNAIQCNGGVCVNL